MINRGSVPITREVFLAMSEADKERVMYILADIGLNEVIETRRGQGYLLK